MAPKKKPITLGKGTGYTKPVTPDRAGRPVSAKPGQPSKTRAAAKTTSSGITQRPDGRAQGEGRSGRQSISRATVTSASNGKPTGTAASRVTMGRGGMGKPMGRGIGPAAVAIETLKARPTADGTLTAAMKRGDYKPATPKTNYDAQERRARAKNETRKKNAGSSAATPNTAASFNDAFKDARRAKVSTFTWRGKKYTTEMK